MHWRRKWQPTPVFFRGESQGWEAWLAAVYGVTQSQTRLKQRSSSSSSILYPSTPEEGQPPSQADLRGLIESKAVTWFKGAFFFFFVRFVRRLRTPVATDFARIHSRALNSAVMNRPTPPGRLQPFLSSRLLKCQSNFPQERGQTSCEKDLSFQKSLGKKWLQAAGSAPSATKSPETTAAVTKRTLWFAWKRSKLPTVPWYRRPVAVVDRGGIRWPE